MKWKKYCISLLAFLPVLFLFIFSSPVNATTSATVVPFSVYWRSYSIENNVVNDSGFRNNLNQIHVILQLTEGVYKQLYGYSLEFPITDGTDYSFKKLQVEYMAMQYPDPYVENNSLSTSRTPLYLEIETTAGNKQSTVCAVSRTSEAGVMHSCEITITDSSDIVYAQIVRGTVANATAESPIMGVVCGHSISPGCYAEIAITNVAYQLTGSYSPEYSQNQTIISQNEVIIEQNAEIISQLQNQQQQEQEQYEAEKQEESEREESGNESADQMAGVFNFSIPNPFLPILSMFTDGGSCVSIPTIASMVGSDETQFCPWFPASVRNVLTPVIGLSSSIILFGFVVGWLTGATRGSIEQVEEVSK